MAGNGADTEPWRQLSSSTLKKNTVVFPSQAQVSVGAYIKLLEEQGITGIISMQTTSRGQCRLTVESYEKAKLLVLNGFDCKGERVSPCFVSAPTTQLHIHDAPIWISDGVLKAALSPYGKLIGEIRHGKIKLSNGTQTATGVRFATFELKPGSSIPSYLRTTEGSHELRIIYDGQVGTCRLCGQLGHIARTCQNRRSAHTYTHAGREGSSTGSTERNMNSGAEAESHRTDSAPKASPSLTHASVVSQTASDGANTTPKADLLPSSHRNDPVNNQYESYEHDIASPMSATSTTVHPGTPPGSTNTSTTTSNSPHTAHRHNYSDNKV